MPQAAPNIEKLDEHLQEVVRALRGAVRDLEGQVRRAEQASSVEA